MIAEQEHDSLTYMEVAQDLDWQTTIQSEIDSLAKKNLGACRLTAKQEGHHCQMDIHIEEMPSVTPSRKAHSVTCGF